MSIIPTSISARAGRVALHASKHSPNLLFVGGVVGVIGTVVLASRATLHVEEILSETSVQLKEIGEVKHAEYTNDKRQQDKAVIIVRSVLSITKLYGPALVVGVASIGMLTKSHTILTKRNAAVTAAYAAIDKGFREYRGRVVDDLGEEADRKYLYAQETDTVRTTDKDGKKVSTKKTVNTELSPYGVMFNSANPNWNSSNEYNLMFLKGVQTQVNDNLRAYGHVILNDVLKQLGFEATSAGCVVGWVHDNPEGDGFIDFGIFNDDEFLRVVEYAVGHEGEMYIDFNVDGIIYDKI